MGLADSSRRIRIADIELAYRVTGRGKPVILVHGLACGQRMWFHQRWKLSDRHTVITYDQRGHGHSDAPDDSSCYSAGHLTRDLAGMVDALNFDKVAIVGFSMGGAGACARRRETRANHASGPRRRGIGRG
jgi:pimeloyl-ACP methyl ester carboxylesterase